MQIFILRGYEKRTIWMVEILIFITIREKLMEYGARNTHQEG